MFTTHGGTHKHRRHGIGNPIKNGSVDKRDEYMVLQVIPNFTPQHFSSFMARMGVQLEEVRGTAYATPQIPFSLETNCVL